MHLRPDRTPSSRHTSALKPPWPLHLAPVRQPCSTGRQPHRTCAAPPLPAQACDAPSRCYHRPQQLLGVLPRPRNICLVYTGPPHGSHPPRIAGPSSTSPQQVVSSQVLIPSSAKTRLHLNC